MRGHHLVTFAEKNILGSDNLVRGFAVSGDNRLVGALSKIAVNYGGFLFARIQPHIIWLARQHLFLLLLKLDFF